MRSFVIRYRATAALVCVMLALSACGDDPAAPGGRGAGSLDEAVDLGAPAATTARTFALACAPAAILVPRGSTLTVSCSLTMPPTLTSSLTFRSMEFPRGVRLHLAGADSTSTVAAGTSTTVFLAADVDSNVAVGHYSGTLLARARGAAERLTLSIEVTTSTARVRMVYLIPSDRAYDPAVAWGMERAIRHLQIFFQEQLGAGGTFAIHLPVVDVVRSERPSSYYAANAFGGVGADVFAALGGRFYDPTNIWAVYFDVTPTSATGGAASLATLPHGDVVGITGQDPQQPIRRWIGGLGHEIGHAMGLPHPPGCDQGVFSVDCNSIMYWGVYSYPATFIAESQKPMLTAGPYVQPVVTTTPVFFDPDAWGPTLLPAQSGAALATSALAGGTAAEFFVRERRDLVPSGAQR